MQIDNIWTIIPSGGKGTRLFPFTADRAKSIVPMLNNFPILELTLFSLATAGGLKNFVFGAKGYINYTGIHNYFLGGAGWSAKLDINPRVHFEYQYPHYQDTGNADCILYNVNAFNINDPVIVVPNDNFISGSDVIEAYKNAIQSPYLITVLLTYQPNVTSYGYAIYDEDTNLITQFKEKPKTNPKGGGYVNTGIYIIKPQAFKYLQGDMGKDVLSKVVKKDIIGAHLIKHPWYDFGDPKLHLKSLMQIMQTPPPCIYNFLTRVCTTVTTDNSVVFVRGQSLTSINNTTALIEKIKSNKIKTKGNIFIGKGCQIADGVEIVNSCIGDMSNIGSNVKILNSNVLDVCQIGDDSVIRNSFLGRGCQIGNQNEISASFVGDGVTTDLNKKLTNQKIHPHTKI